MYQLLPEISARQISGPQPLQLKQFLKIILSVCARAHACSCFPRTSVLGGKRSCCFSLPCSDLYSYMLLSNYEKTRGRYQDETSVPLRLVLQLRHSPLAEGLGATTDVLVAPWPSQRRTLVPRSQASASTASAEITSTCMLVSHPSQSPCQMPTRLPS